MLSKARIKLIQSLAHKKQRSELKLFVVEGKKQVTELCTSNLKIQFIVATPNWADAHSAIIKNNTELIIVSADELKKASLLQAPQEALAVVEMPDDATFTLTPDKLTIALDGIQDPGNLGTIIRIADWYGIPKIVCSEDCVDVYNPKTIQATMGSFIRVEVSYCSLPSLLSSAKVPVYGAFMEGQSIHEASLQKNGVLVIGNEGKGISELVSKNITHPITIPKFGGAESLNAGIATAIICDAFARS